MVKFLLYYFIQVMYVQHSAAFFVFRHHGIIFNNSLRFEVPVW